MQKQNHTIGFLSQIVISYACKYMKILKRNVEIIFKKKKGTEPENEHREQE